MDYTQEYQGLPTFWGFYQQHKEECSVKYRSSGWAESTEEQYDRILLNHILPRINGHNNRPISSYSKKEFDNIIELLASEGKDHTKQSHQAFFETTLSHFRTLIFTILETAENHFMWYDSQEETPVSINKPRVKEAPFHKTHTLKSLTVKQEIDIVNHILKNIPEAGEYVGLFLMYALGLRNEEAAAVEYGNIIEFSDYPGSYYLEVLQTTEIGDNTIGIEAKSDNAYRRIPISQGVLEVLWFFKEWRRNALAKKGRRDINESRLPIAWRKKQYDVRCSANDITNAGRKAFIDIGMRKSDLCDLAVLLSVDAATARENGTEAEFAQIEKEPTAYLLRRNWATFLFLAGLEEYQIHYIMGHEIENPNISRKDISNDEFQLMQIKKKLDLRLLLNPMKEKVSFAVPSVSGNYLLEEHYRQEILLTDPNAFALINISATRPDTSLTLSIDVPQGTEIDAQFWQYSVLSDRKLQNSTSINAIKCYHEEFVKLQESLNKSLIAVYTNKEKNDKVEQNREAR